VVPVTEALREPCSLEPGHRDDWNDPAKQNGNLNAFMIMAAGWTLVLFPSALLVMDDFNIWSQLASSIIIGVLLGWVTWRFTQTEV
jgi:hypothetical protein